MCYLLSILIAFLAVITLTISENINPKHHQLHDESAPPDGLINYQPPTTDLQKLVGLKYVRGPNQQRLRYIALPPPPPPFQIEPPYDMYDPPYGPNQHQPRHKILPPHKPRPIPIPNIPHIQPPNRGHIRPPPKM
jgi:hypothetical protein